MTYRATITYATAQSASALETEQVPCDFLSDALANARLEACRVARDVVGLTRITVTVEVLS
jgi:hypothetical protein